MEGMEKYGGQNLTRQTIICKSFNKSSKGATRNLILLIMQQLLYEDVLGALLTRYSPICASWLLYEAPGFRRCNVL